MNNPIKERKFGKFEIPYKWLKEQTEVVFEIMSRCIIIRAEYQFYSNSIEYEAASNDFEKTKVGERMYKYGISINSFITKDKDKVNIKYVFDKFTKEGHNYIHEYFDPEKNLIIEEI